MSVRNIECQIARSQIGRYLSGDAFSPESLKQLEAHVAECDDCKESLNQRKAALQAMLGTTPAVAVVEVQEPAPTWFTTAFRKKQTATEEPVKIQSTTFWKPMMYSLALGAVLITMSLYSKSMTTPFGNKVIDETAPTTSTATGSPATVTAPTPTPTFIIKTGEFPDTEKPVPVLTTPKTDVKPTTTPAETNATTTAPPTPAPALVVPSKQVEEPAAKPIHKARPKKKARQKTHAKKAASHKRVKPSTIRVYDSNGTLISN